jgi:tight adherence protein B
MLALELSFYLAIFVAAIFAFDVIMEFAGAVQTARQAAANRRARLLAEGGTALETLHKLSGGRSRVARGDGPPDRLADATMRLEDLLARGGVNWSLSRFAQIVALVAVGIAAVLFFALKASLLVALVFAVAGSAGAAMLFLFNRVRARKARMAEQLPDVVDMIVRSLQAGHPIRAALTTVANDAPDPLGSEIGIAVDEMTFGLELEEALDNLRQRVAIPDLDYMVVAINIHARTGGNLAEILSNLSGVIRDRYRLFKKVRALSAEGRLSAAVIAAVPFVIALILGLSVPNYYADAMKHPSFWKIALTATVLYAAAIGAIWRIIKIRV